MLQPVFVKQLSQDLWALLLMQGGVSEALATKELPSATGSASQYSGNRAAPSSQELPAAGLQHMPEPPP